MENIVINFFIDISKVLTKNKSTLKMTCNNLESEMKNYQLRCPVAM